MSIGYASGMRRERVKILNPAAMVDGEFGRRSAGVTWTEAGSVWAAVDFVRGKMAMNAGALDVYGVVMVRMDYDCGKLRHISPRSRIEHNGETYQILGDTFHANKQDNIIQFNAQIVID